MITQEGVEIALEKLENMQMLRKARSTGDWYMIHCPFHSNGQEKKPSCGVLLHDQVKNGRVYKAGMFHCFACGTTLELDKAVKRIFELKGYAYSGLQWCNENIPGFDAESSTDETSLIPTDLMSGLMDRYAADDLRVRLNLKKPYVSEEELKTYRFVVPKMYERKLTNEIIEKYDVGFDPNHVPPGRKNKIPCITFPVRDAQGNTLFICRRSIEGKYFSLPKDVVKPVYGLYELPKDAKSVIICESCFNCLTAVRYGYNAVALLGTGDPYQIDQLKKLGVHDFVLCLDPDEAGHKGEVKLKHALSSCAMVWTMHMPEGKDANDCTEEEFNTCYMQRD